MASGPARRERKVVTILFADLVGFTARSESLDPEDVDAILRPYHERLRTELEQRGGTVEKFVGDAVMAVFGAPVVHEDDPERAVRAALAICHWVVEDGTLEVRVAVNTGEALVHLDARPELGEGMVAGDVVNTASRLQGAAPRNGILVGAATYRATRHVIDYRDHAAVEAKGKAEPVPVWEVVAARARVGAEVGDAPTPLVGRERERALLFSTFDRACSEPSTQLVTIAGVPGIGKSRLVGELFNELEHEADLTNWRRGRSLPYGEGGALWAFGDMVKAQAGILETDAAADAERKLHEAVVAALAEDDVQWVEERLGPLIGLGGQTGAREEYFGAWRRFVEALAGQRPTVLVFEDVHWSNDELLDFIDELVGWVTDVPLMVVATARPELFDRRPNWGGGNRNALTISLAPLADSETARLLAALLGQRLLPAEQQRKLLARAGGNPLYAEQFARMFAERGEVNGLLPETLQGIITARVDSLPPQEKAVLLDAAVLGQTFWRSALDGEDVDLHLLALQRKEFIRRERRSAVSGESEYAFAHLLIRDVAYAQLPRMARAERHARAARWVDSLAVDRRADLAELGAHHYLSALELFEATGVDPSDLVDATVDALLAAAEQALRLFGFTQAAQYASRALDLAGHEDPRRPRILLALASAQGDLAQVDAFSQTAAQAAAGFVADGDLESAARVENLTAAELWSFGRRDEAHAAAERALALVHDLPVSPTTAAALDGRSRLLMLAARDAEAIALATPGLAAARQFDDRRSEASLLITLGTARSQAGPRDFAELEEGADIADRLNLPLEYTRGHNNIAELLFEDGDIRGAATHLALALEKAERLRVVTIVVWLLPQVAAVAYHRGDWTSAEENLRRYQNLRETTSANYTESQAEAIRAAIAYGHGESDANAIWQHAASLGREMKDPQARLPALSGCARFLVESGHHDDAAALYDEILSLDGDHFTAFIDLGWVMHDLGRPHAARLDGRGGVWGLVGAQIARGQLETAAATLAQTGFHDEAAYARLRAAEGLSGAERATLLEPALAFYRAVGATAFVARAEALLPASA
jgi:class 3 adenylate cyclase/tetratricopeptide (TPR) repeat protein